jgi:hypothetical protein
MVAGVLAGDKASVSTLADARCLDGLLFSTVNTVETFKENGGSSHREMSLSHITTRMSTNTAEKN